MMHMETEHHLMYDLFCDNEDDANKPKLLDNQYIFSTKGAEHAQTALSNDGNNMDESSHINGTQEVNPL